LLTHQPIFVMLAYICRSSPAMLFFSHLPGSGGSSACFNQDKECYVPDDNGIYLYVSGAILKVITQQHWFVPIVFHSSSMHPRQKKKVFLYAGIGFVSIGVLSIVLTYMLLYW
jgi:hypothetical protein